MARHLDKLFHDVENENFEDSYDKTKPVIPQIEEFAKKYSIELEKGWKVSLAKYIKQQLLRGDVTISNDYIEKWEKLFNQFNLTNS